MLTLRPGSQSHRLVTILSAVGEYPLHSLHLLGNVRVLRDLIRRLTQVQIVRNPETGERLETKVLQLSGKGCNKSIRLYKGALPLLDWIHRDAFRYYMASFWNHRFPGDLAHRDRNHRLAETVALCASAKIEVLPYCLPKLQRDSICYRCARCRREFASLEEATACEDSHLQVLHARIKEYSVHKYPFMLEVTFSDGSTREYIADNMN